MKLHYINYERQNTGRCYAHVDGPNGAKVEAVSNMHYIPDHPAASEVGYVYLINLHADNLTKEQAKTIAALLMRFARTGEVKKGNKK